MLHLIQGDDEYRVAIRRDELHAQFLKPGDAAVERYDGSERDVDLISLFQAVSTASFFEPRKIIILENAEKFFEREKSHLAKKGGMKILEDILGIGDDVLIILTAHEKKIAKNTRVYKLIAKNGKVTELRKFWHDPNQGVSGELGKWLHSELSKRKLKLDSKLQNLLIARVGSDLRQISMELDKIETYLDNEPVTTLDPIIIRQLVPASRDLIIFNLIDAVAQKKLPRALAFLGDLISLGSNESYIVTMLHRQLKQIYTWNILKKRNVSVNDRVRELGLSDFTRKKLETQVGNFPTSTLPFMISALIRADEEIKTSSLDRRIILEKLVVRLAG